METKRDGFEVVDGDGKVVHFVACDKDGTPRERVERGLLMKTDTERFFVRDTRDSEDT